MHIDPAGRYLVLGDAPTGSDKSISIVDDLSSAVERWTSGTRLSPIWRIRGGRGDDSEDEAFASRNDLIFFGPIRPSSLFAEIEAAHRGTYRAWLSAGCLNLILCKRSEDFSVGELERLKSWIQNQGAVFEHWEIVDGIVRSTSHPPLQSGCTDQLTALGNLLREECPTALLPAVQEYGSLMASSLTRAAAMSRADFDNLVLVADAIAKLMKVNRENKNKVSTLSLQGTLMTMNAALSRFASQAFSGIPPIMQTECHFWTHSLLGTGTANLALMRLTSWIQDILGEARLEQQIASLRSNAVDVPTRDQLIGGNATLDVELIVPRPDGGDGPIIPLVTYFSGRDGFSSHLQTLSAPITTISECNSWRSSLLTITHEVSHIFMQSVLADLYPSDDPGDIARAARILKPGFQAANWHEAACQLVLEALWGMELTNRSEGVIVDAIADQLENVLATWSREAQEVVVHSFDFLYFYGSEAEFYIKSIWHSWCAIPGIEGRVREYLLRTLCAISAPHLDVHPHVAFDAARRTASETLSALVSENVLLAGYADTAVKMLNRVGTDADYRSHFRNEYAARLLLVRLVRIFFYSERLAARLFSDSGIRGRNGYDAKPLDLDIDSVGNPLRFLKEHLRDNPSEAESLWVLQTLAYDANSARSELKDAPDAAP